MKDIDEFVRSLAKPRSGDRHFNMYWGRSKSSMRARHNLRIYLDYAIMNQAKIMLVGEAPGYLGAAKTGVPFCSPSILHHFSHSKKLKFQCPPDNIVEKTANYVWKTLSITGLGFHLWNIFPYHPHVRNDRASNRKPTLAEIRTHYHLTANYIRLTGADEIIALGRVAEKGLKEMGIYHQYVRHPSFGGHNEFQAQMEKLLTAYS